MNLVYSIIAAVVIFMGGFFLVPSTYDKGPSESLLSGTSYPTSLDVLTNPTSGDKTNSPSHADQHANANDAIEALQTKVGINGSAVTTTHDYKLSGVGASDKAVSLTGTEVLTNKTLTAPTINSGSFSTSTFNATTTLYGTTTINGIARLILGSDATGDIYYRNSSGLLTRLGIGGAGEVLKVAGGVPTWAADSTAAATTSTMILSPLPGSSALSCSISPTDTAAYVGYVTIPFDIDVSKVTFRTGTNVASTSPFDFVLYSGDGQTQVISLTTAGGHSANTVVSTVIATTTVSAGNYYVSINVNTSDLMQVCGFTYGTAPFSTTEGLYTDVTSEKVLSGTVTISGGAPAATITPSGITENATALTAIRFDN